MSTTDDSTEAYGPLCCLLAAHHHHHHHHQRPTMWNPSALQNRQAALPVHTARARWGSRPGTIEMGGYSLPWHGYAPDWHILTIRYDPADRAYPFFVTGWLPVRGTDGAEASEPFCWQVPALTDARYDLTEAVAITAGR